MVAHIIAQFERNRNAGVIFGVGAKCPESGQLGVRIPDRPYKRRVPPLSRPLPPVPCRPHIHLAIPGRLGVRL